MAPARHGHRAVVFRIASSGDLEEKLEMENFGRNLLTF